MAESDFERYKAALKAGHLALIKERLPEALAHYEEAAQVAPDRPLPHASQGQVLLRLGRTDEALSAFARALGRAPRDEAALAGRAEALLSADRRAEAGEILERLAEVEVASGRLPEGLATMRRAAGLHGTKRRGRRLEELERELAAAPVAPPMAAPAAAAVTPAESPTDPQAPPSDPPDAKPMEAEDPVELEGRARLEVAYGHTQGAVSAYLATARARAARGEPDAALEACQEALRLAPADGSIHLALVRQYIDRGWRDLARQKLELLRTLDGLDPQALDEAGRTRLGALGEEVGLPPPGPPPSEVTQPA